MLLNELFQLDEVGGVGVVAANKKMAADPRYSMSMTVDVKPGETQAQAKKFGNSVNKMGLPPKLKTNGQVSEAVMSATVQGRHPVSAGARGLMGARWKYSKVVKEAELANLKNAVAALAQRVPEVEKVNYDSVDAVMQEICHKFNIDPHDLHNAFKNKYKLTPDAYSIKVKHERNNKHKSI
jgi:hypothetical protein